MKEKLRIGFIINDTSVPAWYFETIKTIAGEDGVEIFFIRITTPQKQEAKKKSLFYKWFCAFEDWWFKPQYNALAPMQLDEFFKNENLLELNAGHKWLLSNEQLEKILSLQLHVIYVIDFSLAEKENISTAAMFGLWHIQFGYGHYFPASLPSFWEVMDDSAVNGSYLLMRKNGIDHVLYEGTTATVPYSVKSSFHQLAWRTASYFLHRIKTLQSLGSDFFERYNQPISFESSAKKAPASIDMPGLFIKNLFGYLRYKLKRLSKSRFTLLYSYSPFSFEKKMNFRAVTLHDNQFVADPFLIKHDNKLYLFFEDYSYSRGKAHISVMELKDGQLSAPLVALDLPYHLSYPFVFFHEGDYYMIPETSGNKTVELYKAENFPLQWKHVTNLIEDTALIDATLHFENGKWWLFANSNNHPSTSTNDQLFLYYSDDLFSGKWTPHPQNPIATHAGNCRPAGRLFRQDGKPYRPAQNNESRQYGYALKINEVEVMNENEYREKEIFSINPEEYGLIACHHIDIGDGVVVIDGVVK